MMLEKWLAFLRHSSHSRPSIGVVDNDPDYRATLRDKLQIAGYHVVETDSPQRVLQWIREHTVQLLLLDVHLQNDNDPNDRSGLELLHQLPPNTKVIMITADEHDGRLVRDAYNAAPGATQPTDWLFKSDGFTAIIKAVSQILAPASTATSRSSVLMITTLFVITAILVYIYHTSLKNLAQAIFAGVAVEIIAFLVTRWLFHET